MTPIPPTTGYSPLARAPTRILGKRQTRDYDGDETSPIGIAAAPTPPPPKRIQRGFQIERFRVVETQDSDTVTSLFQRLCLDQGSAAPRAGERPRSAPPCARERPA